MILFKTSREGLFLPKHIVDRDFSRTFLTSNKTTFLQKTVNEFITSD